jgi:hypothetical protein
MRLSWLALLVPATLLSAGGTILAAHAGDGASTPKITACARLKDGRLRVSAPDVACRRNEQELQWNIQGEPGATGPTGPPGPGLKSLEDLGGLACHTGGQDGTAAISYDASRRATITCLTAGGAPAIKINEFSTGVTGAATNEFVELVNVAAAAVSIGGLRVVYRSANGAADATLATLPSGTMLASGTFYLLGGSGYAGAIPADQSFAPALAATGGSIGVRDSGGSLLDAVAYGAAANGLGEGLPAPAPPVTAMPGSSAVRLPDGHDTDDNAVDFSVTDVPTPKGANIPG